MSEKDQLLPDEGEVVLATIVEITSHGAYVTLDEYSNVKGFLHISEISSGWVKHIERFIKEGQKSVLKVVRINKTRKETDLSLRRVTDDEKRNKLILLKKEDNCRSVIKKVALDLQLSDIQVESFTDKILLQYPSLYAVMDMLLEKGSSVLTGLSLPEDFAQRVYLVAKEKLSPPPVVVHEIIQISSTSSNGLEVIKQVFTPLTATDHEGSKTSIKYVSAPNYRLSVTAANYKIAERNLKRINETIQKEAKKLKCTVLIQRI